MTSWKIHIHDNSILLTSYHCTYGLIRHVVTYTSGPINTFGRHLPNMNHVKQRETHLNFLPEHYKDKHGFLRCHLRDGISFNWEQSCQRTYTGMMKLAI